MCGSRTVAGVFLGRVLQTRSSFRIVRSTTLIFGLAKGTDALRAGGWVLDYSISRTDVRRLNPLEC